MTGLAEPSRHGPSDLGVGVVLIGVSVRERVIVERIAEPLGLSDLLQSGQARERRQRDPQTGRPDRVHVPEPVVDPGGDVDQAVSDDAVHDVDDAGAEFFATGLQHPPVGVEGVAHSLHELLVVRDESPLVESEDAHLDGHPELSIEAAADIVVREVGGDRELSDEQLAQLVRVAHRRGQHGQLIEKPDG